MRWWLQTTPPYQFSVDNASVSGMDYAELLASDPALWMVHWTEGAGEIERLADTVDPTNDNGLREGFYDVSPYVPYFDQFLERIPRLTLNQAKKIKIDLVRLLFDSKRQLPFHYPIAAGDYYWDASDDTMGASTALGNQNTTAAVNQMAIAINNLVALINSYVVDATNSGIVPVGNLTISQVNSIVVQGVNATVVAGINSDFSNLATEINNGISTEGNLTISYLNNTVVGSSGDGANTVNNKLHTGTFPVGETTMFAAMPGLNNGVDISHHARAFGNVSAWTVSSINAITPGTFAQLVHIPWTPIGNVSTTNVQWIPIGSTVPVTVTPAEQTAIISGIANRTNELNLVKNQKAHEINALTTVEAVIDYDVLAGWPVIAVPPGYKLPAPLRGPSAVSIVGTPGAPTEGVPEAPNDGVTYGRRNMAWNPSLALSGDTLDGGTF